MRFVAILLLLSACATVPVPKAIYSGKDLVEQAALPPDPATETLVPPGGQTYTGTETQVAGVSKGDPAPFDGICSSEVRAARDGIFRVREGELRTVVIANNTVITAQRKMYEDTISRQATQIEELKPNFFERHAVEFGVVAGVVLGVGVSVAAFHAVAGK